MKLKSYQRAFLRSQAQALSPIVNVGKEGLSDGVVEHLDAALTSHELVKVRFQSSKDQIKDLSNVLEEKTDSVIVATTGFTTVFFRQDESDPERIYRI